MIKIDLHIHTLCTPSDSSFEFSLEYFQGYVKDRGLDAVAITNHNLFDAKQFNQIKDGIQIPLYPGIEINFEGGHLLVISDGKDIDGFSQRCGKISRLIDSPDKFASVSELRSIFPDLENYLVIPHYEKVPIVPDVALRDLAAGVSAGEVSSHKKFIYCQKQSGRLVPVFFSDARMKADGGSFPMRQTFLSCQDATFSTIRACLRDKNKVSLSEAEGKNLFQLFEDGQKLSLGLNVVIGERSSGKSFTLDKIAEHQANVKYIKQFTLVERNEEKDKKNFDDKLSNKRSLFTDQFLSGLKRVTSEVMHIDLEANETSVAKYLDTLKKYAQDFELSDSFSKSKLFGEEEFSAPEQEELRKLIASVKHLIENVEFKETIQRHLPISGLKSLIVNLMQEYSVREQDRLKRIWLNGLIEEIKIVLRNRTAFTPPQNVDLNKVAMDRVRIEKFEELVKLIRTERVVKEDGFFRFKVVASSKAFTKATDAKSHSGQTVSLVEAFKKYDNPYQYLRALMKTEGVDLAKAFRCFAKVDYRILNEDGHEVSGGERSEFNLLQELKDAQAFDILLIDEPESSFDNIFLNEGVNQLIKDISRTMPVVVVTHNSTVGASIKPDYILCTRKDYEDGKPVYRIFSGFPADKELKSTDGRAVNSHDVTLGCLEAGYAAYVERRRGYEDLKN